MKKVFVPTALALFLATNLIAAEEKKSDVAAPVTEKTASSEETKKHEATVEKAEAKKEADDKAKSADAKPAVVTKHHHVARHHSNVNIKVANELTEKLNKMTCPIHMAPAAPVA